METMLKALALALIVSSTQTPFPTPPDMNRSLTPGTPIPTKTVFPTPPDMNRTLTPGTPVPLIERVWLPVLMR